ncbi:MAG: Spermidine/putrescine import ATP-binding protein PotA [Pseudomonadota bacterium]|jgi:iron(III) transport system ATP-binding protein
MTQGYDRKPGLLADVRRMLGRIKRQADSDDRDGKTSPPGNLAGTRVTATFAASLTFEGVSRRFGDRDVLDDVSLKINPGEIVCVLGPSGSGKTTLLRITSGIERPTGGRVLIDDIEVAGPNRFVEPERRNVGLMFQDFALFPHLSILDNVAFGLTGLVADEARAEAHAMLARVGLAHHATSYPSTLSGGEQQRVALARALAPRPAVMLMDEPFSGLDVQLRESVMAETLSLLRETRATCLVVTHSPAEALRMADRIAVMRGGKLLQLGTAEELYHKPAALFVARLFSEINEIPGKVVDGSVKTPFGFVPAPGFANGTDVIVAIRTGAISVAADGTGGLPARVLGVRFMGDSAVMEIGAMGFEKPLLRRIRSDIAPKPGRDVGLTFDASGILIFPANDG